MSITRVEAYSVIVNLQDTIKLAKAGKIEEDYVGLCFQLMDAQLPCQGYDAVNQYSVGWEHHTGNYNYPVERLGDNLWAGEELHLRLDLMNYMIDKLTLEFKL